MFLVKFIVCELFILLLVALSDSILSSTVGPWATLCHGYM